jgi:lysophospholipid acyltransferase (LPLAT)-like uncharacterized protein
VKIRHPLLIRGVGAVGAWMIRRLVGTVSFHFQYEDPSVDPVEAMRRGQRYIYAFFHEVMLFPAYYWNWPEMHILVSDHADGEMITQVVRRLGFSVVRGSTTRGGARALREMENVTDGNLCFTPDGPRGPRRHVHQGMIYTASRLGLPIVGAGMAFSHCWRARSWDRFAVPRPFTSATCVVPPALLVPADADREALEVYRIEVERRMNAATDRAEAWAAELAAKGGGEGRKGSALHGPHRRSGAAVLDRAARRDGTAE